MNNWLKRRWFYNFTPLGRKIYADYRRLCRSAANVGYNYSADPKRYISFGEIQWSIAHRINIKEEDAWMFSFLRYVPHQFYVNNPTRSNRS